MKKSILSFIIGAALSALLAVHLCGTPALTQKDINNESLNAILWQQTSAEYRALCYQAYNSALDEVKAAAKIFTSNDKPLAIILDCDETVLDNSRADAAIIDREDISVGINAQWFKAGEAGAMPGAKEFLDSVDSLGVRIFYVTNRGESTRADTMRNMKALEFPQVDDAHVILKSDESSKDSRFSRIAASYDVVVYLGDSAHDFPMGIYYKGKDERNAITDANKSLFGRKYIVLPNPVYGLWMWSIADGYDKMSPAEQHKAKTDALRIWKK